LSILKLKTRVCFARYAGETNLLVFTLLTAIADQTSHKKNFESVASQRFQNFSWLGFEREALYD
jgi:hypothetical protein